MVRSLHVFRIPCLSYLAKARRLREDLAGSENSMEANADTGADDENNKFDEEVATDEGKHGKKKVTFASQEFKTSDERANTPSDEALYKVNHAVVSS